MSSTPIDDDTRIRRLETLLKVDERLTKLEESQASKSRARMLHPATLAALLGIVPPMTSAVYGAVSGIYAQRLKADETRDARLQKYLETALDHTVPLENRLQMMRYLENSDDAAMAAWAGGELARLSGELAEAKEAQESVDRELRGAIMERDALAEAMDNQLRAAALPRVPGARAPAVREPGARAPEVEPSPAPAAEAPRLDADTLRMSRLDQEIARKELHLDQIRRRISDVPSPFSGADGEAPAQAAWVIQVTTDRGLDKAKYELDLVQKAGHKAALYQRGTFYHVATGPYSSRSDALAALPQARAVRNAGAILHPLSSWCPDPEPADGLTRCR